MIETILRDLMQHASEAGDHTPESFCKGVVALANRAHKALASPPPQSAPQDESYCLFCEKEGHRTNNCWSTHAVNARSREIYALSAPQEAQAATFEKWWRDEGQFVAVAKDDDFALEKAIALAAWEASPQASQSAPGEAACRRCAGTGLDAYEFSEIVPKGAEFNWIKAVRDEILYPLAEQDSELGRLAEGFGQQSVSLLATTHSAPVAGIDAVIADSKRFKPSTCGAEWSAGYVSGRLDAKAVAGMTDADLEDLMVLHKNSTPGKWQQGQTTHHTVSKREGSEPYRIAEFRHAADASFCDAAHEWMPKLIEALREKAGGK